MLFQNHHARNKRVFHLTWNTLLLYLGIICIASYIEISSFVEQGGLRYPGKDIGIGKHRISPGKIKEGSGKSLSSRHIFKS